MDLDTHVLYLSDLLIKIGNYTIILNFYLVDDHIKEILVKDETCLPELNIDSIFTFDSR
jgi:hypothetical protein